MRECVTGYLEEVADVIWSLWISINTNSRLVYLYAAHGFPYDFNPESGTKDDAVKICNIVFALLMQRQRDREYAINAAELKCRLEHNLTLSDSARNRLESRLQAQDREIGYLENKVKNLESSV